MERGLQGKYEIISSLGSEKVKCFIPDPLTSIKPDIYLDDALTDKMDSALVSIGRLDSISAILPDKNIFLYSYIRKEAVLSSMIEGTQSSISDLLLYEIEESPGVPVDDTAEVSNYIKALEHGVKRIDDGFPISSRLFKEIHKILLSTGRGSSKMPGEFRTSQNWIGGSRPGNAAFVPPPHYLINDCMSSLEKFINNTRSPYPILIKAALSHIQFETIHPFLDGNGRLGRLLITLLLYEKGILQEPLLYLSLYFKTHRREYYSLFTEVREKGNWEKWISFFTDAVIFTSEQAFYTARKLITLMNDDENTVKNIGRASSTAAMIFRCFMKQPILNAGRIKEKTGLSYNTVLSGLECLISKGILKELPNRKRNRVFIYGKFLNILNEGTEIDDTI